MILTLKNVTTNSCEKQFLGNSGEFFAWTYGVNLHYNLFQSLQMVITRSKMKCLVVTLICLIDGDHPSSFYFVGQLWTQSEHVLQPKQLLGYVYKTI